VTVFGDVDASVSVDTRWVVEAEPPESFAGQSRTARALWSLADQGLSSLSNFGISLVAAHELPGPGFGSYVLAFYAYTLCLGVAYAVGSEPYQVRFSHEAFSTDLRRARGQLLGTTLAVALIGTVVLLSVAVLSGTLRAPFAVAGLALPGLLMQDVGRQLYFAEGRPWWATLSDGLWVAVSGGAIAVLWVTGGTHSSYLLIAAWACGAWAGAAFGLLHLRVVPRLNGVGAWLRENRSMAATFTADFVSMIVAGQLVIYLLPLIVSLGAVGSMQGAALLYGPLAVVLAGSRVFGVPEGVRIRRRGVMALRRFEGGYGAGLFAIAAAYFTAVLFLPPTWGRIVLGASWAGSSPLLLWIGLSMLGTALAVAPFQGLRILGSGRRILIARSVDAPITIALSVSGALLGGVSGAAMGLGAAKLLAAGIWWLQFLRSCRDGSGGASHVPGSAAADTPSDSCPAE
jgi:hypothetical protein